MNLYIQIKDGQPINHPAFKNNLLEAFKEIPTDWEIFLRVEKPSLGVYQLKSYGRHVLKLKIGRHGFLTRGLALLIPLYPCRNTTLKMKKFGVGAALKIVG